jgi:hypothetical protein
MCHIVTGQYMSGAIYIKIIYNINTRPAPGYNRSAPVCSVAVVTCSGAIICAGVGAIICAGVGAIMCSSIWAGVGAIICAGVLLLGLLFVLLCVLSMCSSMCAFYVVVSMLLFCMILLYFTHRLNCEVLPGN